MNEVDNIILKFQSDQKPRYESMLFNYGTTLLTDFRYGRILPQPPKTVYKAPLRRRSRPLYKPIKDTQTLQEFRQRVPFDLFLKPKDILQTNPRKVQEYHVASEDLELEEVRKTRPRVVLTPEVPIDDADEECRKMLLDDKYMSTFQKDYRYYPDKAGNPVVSPLVPVPAPAKSIQLKKYVDGPMWPVVSPEWRWDSVAWDGRQARSYCEPTKEFWLRGSPKDQPMGRY